MCGVAGYFGVLPSEHAKDMLERFNALQCHRGPDGAGTWSEEGVGLAHTRLAIIDLKSGGQPMPSRDGRYVVILNGEIYNHRQLRGELSAKGYLFSTESDTEVIPAAVDAWGIGKALSRLRGMFALALFDRQARTLTLGRDRFGIKPLYVAVTPSIVLFASEMKALLDTELLDRTADPRGIVDFLTVGSTVSPTTCWAAIEELSPGTWTMFDDARHRSSGQFADFNGMSVSDAPDHELIDRVDRVLLDSCQMHLESDVPVGAFLSGGIDSSLLVAMLSKIRPGLDTFHVRFSDAAYDESSFARRVAEHCGTRHHELFLPSHTGTIEQLTGIIDRWDQPFGDSSAIPTWLISQKISQHVKVAISGDGGDEIFGGYTRYRTVRWLQALHGLPRASQALRLAAAGIGPVFPDRSRQVRKLVTLSAMTPAARMVALHTYLDGPALDELFVPEITRFLERAAPTEARLVSASILKEQDPTEQLIHFELLSMLHGDYLRKVDVASSAHGLEVRTPMLDSEVAAVGLSLPMRLKVSRGQLKRALRIVASRYLPQDVVRKPKWGFGLPFDKWLEKKEIGGIRDYLLGPVAQSREWVRRPAVESLMDRFERGGQRQDLSRYQVYQRVFMLIALEAWLRRWRPTGIRSAA